MKSFRIIATILVFAMILLSTSSCVVHQKKDNGKHLGWYKTPNKHNKGKSMLWKSSSKKSYNAHFKQPGKRKIKGKNIKNNRMKKGTGLWIDHSKAIVVKITDKAEETELIISDVEKQLRRTGDSILKGKFESRLVPGDDRQQNAITGQLNIYYDEIIEFIQDAEAILIFGPGEAKGELKKRLEEKNLGDLIADIEAADNMTEGQIEAKIREYFSK